MKLRTVVLISAAIALAGCASTEQDRRAGTGALIGAGVGALAGQAIGGNTASTVVGAAAGGIAGAAIGTATTPAGQRNGDLCRYRDRYGNIYRAPCQ
ncbi:MAG: glycine zipper 2TM domain-containing protein [Rhizobiaceae bacterium]|nr:glycine zipper 2TM domain-containing protein [Rhizobiaceae bacterium]